MTDRRIIVSVLLAACLLWLGFGYARTWKRGNVLVVNVKGVDVERVPLARGAGRTTKTVGGLIGRSTFEVEDGRVRMVSSDCPDKVCIRMGWVERQGQAIVCLPNRVVLKVEPE
ncbi:MAG: NusG domain II-containing protein [Firmicutes bacterium]|nr:NusG domain II-containing protein [Bacillota bacterium]